MFERFTEQARQVVVLTQLEARRLGRNYIGTEHMLLGLAGEEDGVAGRVLRQLGMSVDVLRSEVVRLFGRGDDESSGGIPFTPRAKQVLELAFREAHRLGEADIETRHILIALAIDSAGPAALILSNHDVDPERISQEISRLDLRRERESGGSGSDAAASAAATAVVATPQLRRRRFRRRPATGSSPEEIHPRFVGADWVDGLRPLLERLAQDIRRELRRDPDPGDLLIALASIEGAITGRAMTALAVDLDALGATLEQLRARGAEEQQQLLREIEEIRGAKEKAIDAEQFARAAKLREQERDLVRRKNSRTTVPVNEALSEIRRRLGIPSPEDNPDTSAT